MTRLVLSGCVLAFLGGCAGVGWIDTRTNEVVLKGAPPSCLTPTTDPACKRIRLTENPADPFVWTTVMHPYKYMHVGLFYGVLPVTPAFKTGRHDFTITTDTQEGCERVRLTRGESGSIGVPYALKTGETEVIPSEPCRVQHYRVDE